MNLDAKLNFQSGYLRSLMISDIHDGYVAGLNDPEINRYLDGVKHTFQKNETVSTFVQHNIESRDAILFGIWRADASEHCGTIRLHAIEHNHHTANIGICLFDKSVWGQGIGAKAIRAVSAWAVNELNLRWIEAGAYEQNIASQKAFLSAGYDWIYDIPDKYLFEGKPDTVKVYAFKSPEKFN